jgi:hypothetical protein
MTSNYHYIYYSILLLKEKQFQLRFIIWFQPEFILLEFESGKTESPFQN